MSHRLITVAIVVSSAQLAFPSALASGGCAANDTAYGAVIECIEIESPQSEPGTDVSQPQNGGSEIPTCMDAPDRDDCRTVTLCLPYEFSPTGYLEWYASPDIILGQGVCDPSTFAATPAPAAITEPLVRRAFRRVDLPAPLLLIQPPGGETLVNFDTLFRTEAEPFTRTVRLLGRTVDLQIHAASFTWRHGDGSTQTTTDPGRAYEEGVPMDAYVSHRYTDAGVTVHPSVDTTYAARYRVDGGPWRDVEGTVTIAGAATELAVIEGRPVLNGTD